jgi:hypothetical protein
MRLQLGAGSSDAGPLAWVPTVEARQRQDFNKGGLPQIIEAEWDNLDCAKYVL